MNFEWKFKILKTIRIKRRMKCINKRVFLFLLLFILFSFIYLFIFYFFFRLFLLCFYVFCFEGCFCCCCCCHSLFVKIISFFHKIFKHIQARIPSSKHSCLLLKHSQRLITLQVPLTDLD